MLATRRSLHGRQMHKPVCRICLASLGFVVSAILAAASLTARAQHADGQPNAIDQIGRSGLQAQFPRSPTSAYRPGVSAQTLPNGDEGYELNFENTPVATVAEIILGDVLHVGYVIDPRVQGTVSLASKRPIPKIDVLFVLEIALRTANVALVQDPVGYRLVPIAEAVGSGRVDLRSPQRAGGHGLR